MLKPVETPGPPTGSTLAQHWLNPVAIAARLGLDLVVVWSRLESLVLSWINARNDDPLYRDEAWEELEAYLHGGEDNPRRERYRAGERHERTAASTPFPADIRQALFDLELEPGVSAEQIRSAYRRLLLKYHPDRFHSRYRAGTHGGGGHSADFPGIQTAERLLFVK